MEPGADSLKQIREAAFLIHSHSSKENLYCRSRGLSTPESDSYLDILPNLDGKSIIDLIEQRVSEQPRVDLLDIGCGEAQFLIDCKDKWGQLLTAVGLDADPTRYFMIGPFRSALLGSLQRLLKDVHTLKADALEVGAIFEPNSYDIAVSCWVFEYLADPWRALKGVYRALKPRGVGLISTFPFPAGINGLAGRFEGTKTDRDRVITFLETYGVNFIPSSGDEDSYQVTIQKVLDRLEVPIYPKGVKRISYNVATQGMLPSYEVVSFGSRLG